MFIDDNFNINIKGNLTIGGVDTVELAKEFKTPLYVIDENYFRAQCKKIKAAMKKFYGNNGLVCFASKAFCCKEIYRIIEDENLGADTVSIGEMFTAIEAGFNPKKIYLHGNNKLVEELEFAINNDVGRIVVDNFIELNLIEKLAEKLNKKVNILIRVKPGVDAHVHEYIKTGQISSKFGFAVSNGEALLAVKKAVGLKNVNLVGAHCHIGSQILEVAPFVLAAKTMIKFFHLVKKEVGKVLDELNLGGGFGVNYLPNEESLDVEKCFELVFNEIKNYCEKFKLKIPFLVVEPGRFLIAKAGITLYEVGCVKQIAGIKTYVFVNGGMTDNPRYALYRSVYDFSIANKAGCEKTEIVSIAGKCCESGDLLGEQIKLQKAKEGDVLVVFATGAYNYSMASNYNRVLRPAVVFVKDGQARLVVKRETLQTLVENDI